VAVLRLGSRLLHLQLLRAVPAPHGVRSVRLLRAEGLDPSPALEARDHLQRMLLAIPLTDDERAAVEDGAAAVEQLLTRLVDTPTPAGPTPRQLSDRTFIPLSQLTLSTKA
jgi:hypothetical protein